jgi:S-DNA-T family DNA segregation ATPase FtsK/SpoIIIE
MAKTTKKEPLDKKTNSTAEEKKSLGITKQHKIVLGSLLILLSVALLVAFISFYIHGQEDQSAVAELSDRAETVENWRT